MTNDDFLECRFIQEEMRYLTYDEFCENCYEIKSIFKMMNKNAKLFYKWYVYANIHMNEMYKNLIWEYLNTEETIAYLELIEKRRTYKVR
mgnify:CR=1 FL=1